MGKILLVTGGSRSGKSSYALKTGLSLPGPRTFIATCPMTDDEMMDRIEAHRRERTSGDWKTVEEQMDLISVLEGDTGSAVILVDCLTLWVNNLMFREEQESRELLSEQHISKLASDLMRACRAFRGTTIFVSNEVGMGIVPENAYTRRYRDLVGRCNQAIAAEADAVVLVVSGIATFIKGEMKDVIN